MHQPSLFDDLPAPKPKLPHDAAPAEGKVTWTAVAPNRQCDDCIQVSYEQLREGRAAHDGIAKARWRRKQGNTVRLLCNAHKQERERLDAA